LSYDDLWFNDEFSSVIRLTCIEHTIISNAQSELRAASSGLINNRADLANIKHHSVGFPLDHESFTSMSAIFNADRNVPWVCVVLPRKYASVIQRKADVLDSSAGYLIRSHYRWRGPDFECTGDCETQNGTNQSRTDEDGPKYLLSRSHEISPCGTKYLRD
jgi:hypothetical protein